jgi:hypothetical protein
MRSVSRRGGRAASYVENHLAKRHVTAYNNSASILSLNQRR